MIDNHAIVGFVPLRKGSTGIPGKNVKLFCDKPLFYWIVHELLKVQIMDRIVISTDDSLVKELVIDDDFFNDDRIFLHHRSVESANDVNHWEMAIREFIENNITDLKNDDILVMTQVTSPFTKGEQIVEALETYYKFRGTCSLVTCTRVHRFVWSDVGVPLNYNQLQRPRRQDFEGILMENGAFCINSIGDLRNGGSRLTRNVLIYEMLGAHTALEIDTEDDWYYAEYLFRKYNLGDTRE